MTLKSENLRSQEWIPFFTQQQRLRNLIQILGFNLCGDSDNTDDKTLFYYTLHLTTMSSPLYTSEKICSRNPKWTKIDICSSTGSAKAIIVRLWKSTDNQTKIVLLWAIELSGLLYISPMSLEPKMFHSNSLVFQMTGGNYTLSHCVAEDQPTLARISYLKLPAEDLKMSETLSQLTRMHVIQRLTIKQQQSATLLKNNVFHGEINENRKLHQSNTLRRLMNKKSTLKPSRQIILSKKKEIELVKFRVLLLNQEKTRRVIILRNKTKISIELYDDNCIKNNKLAEMNKSLTNERLHQIGDIDTLVQTLTTLKTQLNYRKKQLVSELNYIYPITKVNENISICNVHLPNSEHFNGIDDTQLNVALGYVSHLIVMISYFLDIPLRYPINHIGSRSKIIDNISHEIKDRDRVFPLFNRNKSQLEFNYAVYLLNKNIAQLRLYNGYITNDLRTTLYNCLIMLQPQSSLLKLQSSNFKTSSNLSLESSIISLPKSLKYVHSDSSSSDELRIQHFSSEQSLSEYKSLEYENTHSS